MLVDQVLENYIMTSSRFDEGKEYWLRNLQGIKEMSGFPLDYPRIEELSYQKRIKSFNLPDNLYQKLMMISNKSEYGTYLFLLTGVICLLNKYTGNTDILIGMPVFKEITKEEQYHINKFLALRADLTTSNTFKNLLFEIKNAANNGQKYKDIPFVKIAETLGINSGDVTLPLLNTVILLENIQETKYIEEIRPDIVFSFVMSEKLIETRIEYNSALFAENTLVQMSKYFVQLLNMVTQNPAIELTDIELISEDEKRQILFKFNDNCFQYPKETIFIKLFEEQVTKKSKNIAVSFNGKSLSYEELNAKANQLARVLNEKGLQKDELVGIMASRSLEMIIGILAIFKAGGAYLPIDPNYPVSKIRYICKDSNLGILLTRHHLLAEINFEGEIIDLGEEGLFQGDALNLGITNHPGDLAYVIYTSGSTGLPKGAMIEHAGMINHILAKKNALDIHEKSVIAQNASHCFDISVWQFLTGMIVGGKTIIYSDELIYNPALFIEELFNDQVTILEVVPSFLLILLDLLEVKTKKLNTIQYLLVTGEVVKPVHINKWLNLHPFSKVVNAYGPTEAADDITHYFIEKPIAGNNVLIGKPIQNLNIYIVDEKMKPLPIGIKGEICVSGVGVGRGYLNNIQKTKDVFKVNPFIETSEERLYKTGDLGRWMPDGNIEFFGRKDFQVKIRGFRIELGEIENIIMGFPGIKEAVVIDWVDETGAVNLCAYMVSDEQLKMAQIRDYLEIKLSNFMIPSLFIQLETLPLTSNGKLDRKRLPHPKDNLGGTTEYQAPMNEVEQKLIHSWQEILGVEKIGTTNNFFELGGQSLKAMVLANRIHKEFNVVVPLGEIFKQPTVRELAQYITGSEINIYSSIKPVTKKDYYAVSSAQKRLYLLSQLEGVGTSYNMPGVFILEGELDKERFRFAFEDLFKRHESLRTSFEFINGELVQRVLQDVDFSTVFRVLSDDPLQDLKIRIENEIRNFIRPFDLQIAPLFRVELLELSKNKHILMYDLHHIVSDGVSLEVLGKEFMKLYHGEKLPELKIQYKDFSEWQNELFKSGVIKKQEEYWLDCFQGEVPLLNMPTDYPRPAVQSFEGDYINFKIEGALFGKSQELAINSKITLNMILLAAYNILLSKYTGQEDIVIGMPIVGRPHVDLENIIGMFVNMLALRNYPAGSKTVAEFLTEVRESSLQAYQNQDYQFEELVEQLDLRRDLSRHPLFDVVLSPHDIEGKGEEIVELQFIPYSVETRTTKFDLTLHSTETDNGIIFNIEYYTKLFKRETMERMTVHFRNIFEKLVSNPELKLAELEILSENEKQKLLYEFNDTEAEYPKNKTIHKFFEEQVEKNFEKVAVLFEGESLTYRELNEKGNQLAQVLRDKGVGPDIIVGLMVERSLKMIIGIFGILKAGGAYLPINPEYPEERINYMLQDSKTKLLLTRHDNTKEFTFEGDMIFLDDPEIYRGNPQNLETKNQTSDLAYIIYTSGTTGYPKGAMIEHRNVVRLMFNDRILFDFDENDVWTMFHSYCFDFSVWEMYGALLYGGKLIVISESTAQDSREFLKILQEERVTVLNQVPSAFYNLITEEFKLPERRLNLRYIIFGGEALKPIMLKSWKERYPDTKLINMYGITETTVHVTFKEITAQEIILNIDNIGKPIPTLTACIMDQFLKMAPPGVFGELCVGGDGLGRGYLNRPELTSQKFVQNPYRTSERLYRSGDLARWLENGDLEYSGRIDHQVKIRGFRIELGEIENRLLQFEPIKEVVVIDREDVLGDRYLCAYLVTGNEFSVTNLRESLLEFLPEYMVPSFFIQLEKLPLTANGKVDRKALPEPEHIQTGVEYEAPRNEAEQKLVEIWKELLGVEAIGVNDNFFELGGQSLKAMALVSMIHQEFDVELAIREIFITPTIREIAGTIEYTSQSRYISIPKAPEREFYAVSSAQKRIYLVCQFEGTGTSYNIPGVLKINGILDYEHIDMVFQALIDRHETLRTSFELVDGEPVQRIHSSVNFTIPHYEIIDNIVDYPVKKDEVQKIIQEFIQPFDLSKASLFRVGLIKLAVNCHILVFDMHHIITDGVSIEILGREFVSLYDGSELPELRLQYKDYSEWQNERLKSEEMQKYEKYWLNQFTGEIPILNLPTDYPRPTVKSFAGGIITFHAGEELSSSLFKMASSMKLTLHLVLLAAFHVLLSKCSGQDDIVIGIPVTGRQHPDLEKIIGMFVNTLVIRNRSGQEKPFAEFLNEVKHNFLSAYENQDYQFEMLVEKLNIPRDYSRNILFDVMFMFQNPNMDQQEITGLEVEPYEFEERISKFDLTLTAIQGIKDVGFIIEYSSDLFRPETINRWVNYYLNILYQITHNQMVLISDIEMEAEEKKALLLNFNYDLENE